MDRTRRKIERRPRSGGDNEPKRWAKFIRDWKPVGEGKIPLQIADGELSVAACKHEVGSFGWYVRVSIARENDSGRYKQIERCYMITHGIERAEVWACRDH